MLELALFNGCDGLELNIDDVEGRCCGLGKNFDFGGDVSGELAAVGRAAAGGYPGRGSVVGEEMFELRQGEKRLPEGVAAEIEEGRVFDHRAGLFNRAGQRAPPAGTNT